MQFGVLQLGRDYYSRMATPTTTTGPAVVVDAEAGPTAASTTMLAPKALTKEPLKDAESIYDYISDDIIKKHLAYDFRTTSPTMLAYCNTFKYLVPMVGHYYRGVRKGTHGDSTESLRGPSSSLRYIRARAEDLLCGDR